MSQKEATRVAFIVIIAFQSDYIVLGSDESSTWERLARESFNWGEASVWGESALACPGITHQGRGFMYLGLSLANDGSAGSNSSTRVEIDLQCLCVLHNRRNDREFVLVSLLS